MKNLCFTFLAIALLLVSCAKEKNADADPKLDLQEEMLDNTELQLSPEQSQLQELIIEEVTYLDKFDVPMEHLLMLQKLGYGGSDLQVLQKRDKLNEETYVSYLLETDIEIRQDLLESMIDEGEETVERQYRTTNLVNAPRTIRVTGLYLTGNNIRSGLSWAIDNYNAQPLNLTFTLTFSSPSTFSELIDTYNNTDIMVHQLTSSAAGGIAGFPSGGRPFGRVNIYSGTNAWGANVCEHVIGHEIGHCIGLRHTDWFNRSLSCGVGGSEGQAGVGAIHIPGTPMAPANDAISLMKACFNGSENGEFSNFDITALTTIY